jgi:hypothetical protein
MTKIRHGASLKGRRSGDGEATMLLKIKGVKTSQNS